MKVSSNVIIRPLKKSDIGQLVENALAFYDEVKEDSTLGLDFKKRRPTAHVMRKWHSESYENFRKGNSIYLVAEVDGRIVGKADIESVSPDSEVEHVGSLSVAILKGYRNMGIGFAMFAKLLEKAKAKFRVIRTDVYSDNGASKHLLHKFGFKKAGTIPNFRKRNGKYQNLEIWTLLLKT